MPRIRKTPAVRIEEILAHGLALALQKGFQNVTRDDLARAVGVSPANVSFHFGTMRRFQVECMRAAIKQRNLRVVAQGMAVDFPQCRRLPPELRDAAVESLRG